MVFFIFILIFFTACQEKHKSASTHTPLIHKEEKAAKKSTHPPKVNHYTLQDRNKTIGITISKDGFELNTTKKLSLLLFFASWCPSCKAELEEIEKLRKKYPNVEIIGLQLDKRKLDKDFFISCDSTKNLHIAKKIYPLIQVPSSMPIPVAILLKRGKYVIHYIGATPVEMMELDIKKAQER